MALRRCPVSSVSGETLRQNPATGSIPGWRSESEIRTKQTDVEKSAVKFPRQTQEKRNRY